MDDSEPLTYTGFLIRRAQQRHAATWQREVSSEISSVQFGVLAVLSRMPGASQRELCDELDLDRSSVAEVVARLQRRGLLTRERHGADRRRNILDLSPAGREELERLRPRAQAVERLLTDGLSAAERETLRQLLLRVLGADAIQAAG